MDLKTFFFIILEKTGIDLTRRERERVGSIELGLGIWTLFSFSFSWRNLKDRLEVEREKAEWVQNKVSLN